MPEAPEVVDSGVYAAEVKGEDDSYLPDLADGSDLGHRASIQVDNNQHRDMDLTASHSLSKSVANLTLLAVCCVIGLSDRPTVDRRVGALEKTLQTRNECISALSHKLHLKILKLSKYWHRWTA